MADKDIGGIKVRIGADTSELDNAAARVQTELAKVGRTTEGVSSSLRGTETAAMRFARAVDSDSRSLRGFAEIARRAQEQANHLTSQIDRLSAHEIRDSEIQEYGRSLDELRAKFNPLFAASKQYEGELDEINRAHRVGAINTQEHAAAIAALDARYTAATMQAQVFGGAQRVNSMHLSNVTAQFNDIGMMMASGQSPFMLAIQQGTQLSQVLNQVQNPLQYLRQGFLQMLNPISLLTIGSIAAGAAIFQYFQGVITAGDQTEDVLSRQEDAIRRVVDRWGEVAPTLRAVVDEMDRLAEQSDLEDAFAYAESINLEDARQQLEDLTNWVFELSGELQNVGTYQPQIDQLTSSFSNLRDRIRDGTVTTQDYERVTAALAVVTSTTSIPALDRFTAAFGRFVPMVRQAADAIAGLRQEQDLLQSGELAMRSLEQYAAEQSNINSMTTEQLALHNEINRVRSDLANIGAEEAANEEYITRLAQERLDAERRRQEEAKATRGGGGAPESDPTNAMQTRLEALQMALATEEEAERMSYEKRLEDLRTFLDNRLITEAEFNELSAAAQQQHADRMTEITARQIDEENKLRSQLVGHASTVLGSLSTLFETFGEKNLGIAKAFAVAQAVVNTAEGITKALAQGGMLGFAGAAAVAASGAAQIATILSAGKGGSSAPSVGATAPAEQIAPPPQSIYIQGINQNDFYTGNMVLNLIEEINKQVADGAVIRVQPT